VVFRGDYVYAVDETYRKGCSMNFLSIAAIAFALMLASPAHAQLAAQEEGGAAPAQLAADLNEAIAKVKVTVQPIFGDPRTGEMIVTHFRPAGAGPFPAVIMQHGRGTDRATPGRWRFLYLARYWTKRGFAVFVPTRLGYGDTGLEPDPEETGNCSAKRYDVAAASVSVQARAAVEFAAAQAWVDKSKVILMGQSMGGFATIAAMEQKIPGVIAGINFAGGGGGDPVARRENPCGAFLLGSVFEKSGKANGGATPMLWLYAENDLYWGASLPKKWHEAYVSAGGKAQFQMFPAIGTDGHAMIGTGFGLWRPVVDQFIAMLGFAAPKTPNPPATTDFAPLADAAKLPHVKQETKDTGYRRFLNADLPRAFAIGPKGEWSFQSGEGAMARTLKRCATTAKTDCKLYAVDDAVVWKE
jgi:dienelactone hydrolase